MSWPTVPLGDAVSFKGGGTPSRDNDKYWKGQIPWATVKDLNSGHSLAATQESITEDGLKSSASNLIPSGTVIIPTRMALGKAVVSEIDVAINQDLKAVFPTMGLDPRFLLWYFIANSSRIETMGKGATVKGITLDQLRALQIPLPPLAEQRRIAAVLDKADALRSKRRNAIAKLDQLLQSIFVDMFGDPAKNPKGFDVCALEEISDRSDRINYGVVQPGSEFSNGIPLVRVGDIEGGELDTSSIKHIDPEIESAYTRSRLRGNELLISCVGSIGTVAIVPDSAIGFNIARAITRVPLKYPGSRAFVKACLQSVATQNYFMEKTRTVSQPTLNVEFVKQTPVLSPPTELQQRFSSIASALELQKRQMQVSATQLDTLFASLQHRAFSGEL